MIEANFKDNTETESQSSTMNKSSISLPVCEVSWNSKFNNGMTLIPAGLANRSKCKCTFLKLESPRSVLRTACCRIF